jgi:hypothetical protein
MPHYDRIALNDQQRSDAAPFNVGIARLDRTGEDGDGLFLTACVLLSISRTSLSPGYYRTTKEDSSLTQDCVNDGHYQGYFSLRVHLFVTPIRYRIRQLPDCRFR